MSEGYRYYTLKANAANGERVNIGHVTESSGPHGSVFLGTIKVPKGLKWDGTFMMVRRWKNKKPKPEGTTP